MSTRFVVWSSFLIGQAGIGLLLATPLQAQTIVRVDVANDGTESYGGASAVDVCDDATRVVFVTDAVGLDPADKTGYRDVLLRDLVAGTTKLVSVRTDGAQGNRASSNPRISGDGRFVAFESDASNLVDGDTNNATDVFLRDLAAGTTTRVSIASDGSEADGRSTLLAISSDGGRILFLSYADNLVAGDTNWFSDLFLRDVVAGTTQRVSTAADGSEADAGAWSGGMSRDGGVVVFDSWSDNLVSGDTNNASDAFVKDLATGVVVRASVDSNGGELSHGLGYYTGYGSSISGDGALVLFSTNQPDLAPNDTNGVFDTFLRDLAAGTTSIVSVDSNGEVSAADNVGTHPAGISSDGRFVLLGSDAFALAPNEGFRNYGYDDVYVRDRSLAMTTRQSDNPQGFAGDAASYVGAMTPDGVHVVFTSYATDLVASDTTTGSCAFLLTRPLRGASSSSYGAGLAGTLGVPSLSVAAPPLLNQPVDLTLGNSLGSWTVALLMIGTAPAQIPTQLGGDLLVDFGWSMLVAVAPAGYDLDAKITPDERLASTSLFFQAIELDPGAPHGVAFTAGLELDPGF
jgi:hypothetical protein